jgi:hypothetical protein
MNPTPRRVEKVAGLFGVYTRDDNPGPYSMWGIAEIIGPTGLWIDHPCIHFKDAAIAHAKALQGRGADPLLPRPRRRRLTPHTSGVHP